MIFLMIFTTFLLQTAVFRFLPFVASANLLIILVCSMGFLRGRRSGIWIGFLCGLLSDLFFEGLFGLSALIYIYLGYFSGSLGKIFFEKDIQIPMLLCSAADLLYGLLFYVVVFAFRGRLNFSVYMRHIILPEVIATLLFSLFFYKICAFLNQKISDRQMEDRHSPWLRK